MSHAFYETMKETKSLGIQLGFYSVPGGYHPPHWHDELEILYYLNGGTEICVEHKTFQLPKKQVIVVDSRQIHSTHTSDTTAMFVCIHISKAKLLEYVPDAESLAIRCLPEDITEENFPAYLEICKLAGSLVQLYMEDSPFFALESEGIILQMFARILRHFSVRTLPEQTGQPLSSRERFREIIAYINNHYAEPLTLAEIAEHTGLTREYFCRFFKRNMGISFLEYVNEVRLSHIYHDLFHTDQSISRLMENNGFTNQKLFNQSFKKRYGRTPSQVRKESLSSSLSP